MGAQLRRIGDTYYARNFYAAVARAEGRAGGGIWRVHAQMRMKRMSVIGYLFPKQIEKRAADARDIFFALRRVDFPRFAAPGR